MQLATRACPFQHDLSQCPRDSIGRTVAMWWCVVIDVLGTAAGAF